MAMAEARVASPNAKVSTPTRATTWLVCLSGIAMMRELASVNPEESFASIGTASRRQSAEPLEEPTVTPSSFCLRTFSAVQPFRVGSPACSSCSELSEYSTLPSLSSR